MRPTLPPFPRRFRGETFGPTLPALPWGPGRLELPEFPPPPPWEWVKPWEWPSPDEIIYPSADIAIPVRR